MIFTNRKKQERTLTNRIQKLRLLYLAQILEEETDAEHCLSGNELIERLQSKGVEVERKTLYDDIACLQEFGMDIEKVGNRAGWHIVSREFEDTELQLLADAVQSSRFLTEKKAKRLVKKIGLLGSKHIRASLQKGLFVASRIKNQNETVFNNLDAAERAIDQKKKLSFVYCKNNEKMELVTKRQGRYVVSPVYVLYKDESYYLIALDDNSGTLKNYRLDRMKKIQVTTEDIYETEETKNFDIEKHQRGTFLMYPGHSVKVTLKVRKNAMNAVADAFDKNNVTITDPSDETATIYTEVKESPTFYGWLSQFDGAITLEGPKETRERYVEYLKGLLKGYVK